MKRIIITLIALVALSSCAKLDQSPYDTVDKNKAFKDIKDAERWVVGMYSTLRDNVYGPKMYLTEVQADFLDLRNQRKRYKYNNQYIWTDFTTSDEYTAAIYKEMNLAIRYINIALERFDEIPLKSDAERVQWQAFKGELLMGRAYYRTYLATHYCVAYDPATADTDLGLQLIDDAAYDVTPARSSLKETYERILSDISAAETLLASKTGSLGANGFTIDAAKALKARVLLYQQNWSGAYAAAKEVIDSGKYPLLSDADSFAAIWAEDKTDETIMQLTTLYSSAGNELPRGNNDPYIGYAVEINLFTGETEAYSAPEVIPTQALLDKYENTDIRKGVYYKQFTDIGGEGLFGDTAYLVNKYPDYPALRAATDNPTYAHAPKVFRIAELYLIAAEAGANGGGSDGETYFNALRTARGASTTVTYSLATVKEERARELAFEGFRLFDLQRWKEGVVRGTPQLQSLVITDPAAQYSELNIPYRGRNYHKIVWPIPAADISYERGKILQNPGWEIQFTTP